MEGKACVSLKAGQIGKKLLLMIMYDMYVAPTLSSDASNCCQQKGQVFFLLPNPSSVPLKTSKNAGGFQSTVLSCEYLANIPVKLEELLHILG